MPYPTSRHRWADDGPAGPDPSDFLCECGAGPTGGTPSSPVYADCACDELATAELTLTWVPTTPFRTAA